MRGDLIMVEKNDLFTERVKAGRRTYFLDVKENSKKDKYVVITESKRVDEKYERVSLRIYEEDIDKFNSAFKRVVDFINSNTLKDELE